MDEFTSMVPVVANAAVAVSENITGIITRAKATGIIRDTQIEMLKDQTAKVLIEARTHLAGELVTINLEQLAKTQEYIDFLKSKGQLHGKSFDMAIDQLEDLNNILRRNLRDFENRELW